MVGLINIDTNKLYRSANSAELDNRSRKIKADNYAKANLQYEKETDPEKEQIMCARLALGITDFSDL